MEGSDVCSSWYGGRGREFASLIAGLQQKDREERRKSTQLFSNVVEIAG